MENEGYHAGLKFKQELFDVKNRRKINNMQAKKQDCNDSKLKSSWKTIDPVTEATNTIPCGQGDGKAIAHHYRNTIEEDHLYSDSYLYGKPSTSIGRRKVLIKKKLSRKGGEDQKEDIKHQIVQQDHQTLRNTLGGSTGRKVSQVSPKQEVQLTSKSGQHHPAKQDAGKFNACSHSVCPSYAGRCEAVNIQNMQITPCFKQLNLQTQIESQKTQPSSPPQGFHAQQRFAGPLSVSLLSANSPRYPPSCALSLAEDFGTFGNYILIPQEAFEKAQSGRLLGVVKEEEEEEDNEAMWGGQQKGLPQKPIPNTEGHNKNCCRCDKPAYLAERKVAAGVVFHSRCFTCFTCGKSLDVSTLQEKNSEIFCKFCYIP